VLGLAIWNALLTLQIENLQTKDIWQDAYIDQLYPPK
jgi:hypothetical protein